MKKRTIKELSLIVLFILLIPVILWLTYALSSRKDNNATLPQFSTLNKSNFGYSVFYETMKEFGYDIKRTIDPVEEQPATSVQIVAASGRFDINSSNIKEWVRSGGELVYLSNSSQPLTEYKVLPEYVGNGVAVYKFEKGKIITGSSSALTNKSLMTDSDEAFIILKNISSFKKIYFNETYMFSVDQKKSLWQAIPLAGRFIIYQIALTILVFIIYKGRRFGKSIPLYEEVERVENEYLFAAASLYSQAKCWDLIVDSFYKSLLRMMKSEHEEWVDKWERDGLPDLGKAKKIYSFMDSLRKASRNNERSKPKAEDCEQIISNIDQLKNLLKKRRDMHWKTLKKV